jgi:hypothetical protein
LAAAEAARLNYEHETGIFKRVETNVVSTWLTTAQVRECEQLVAMIGNRSIISAGRAILDRDPGTRDHRELKPFIESFLREVKIKRAHHTWRTLETRIDQMLRETGIKEVREFTPDNVEPWIHAPMLKGRSKINRRAVVTNLARWLAHPKRKIITRDLFGSLDEIQATDSEAQRRLSTAQVADLLRVAAELTGLDRTTGKRVRMLYNFALRTFAGLRPSEVEDLATHPDRVNMAEGYIFVGDARTRTHRAVKITPNARAWFEYCQAHCPEVVFKARLHERIKAATGLGEIWQPDICRHTFGSFYLRRTKNVNTTAEEMGNSPRVIRSFYAVPLTDEELKAFDLLLPPGYCWATRYSKDPSERLPLAVKYQDVPPPTPVETIEEQAGDADTETV